MSGSTFGKLFRVTTFGESHGPAIGAVIDGCPAGLPLTEEMIMPYMEKRRPNAGSLSTSRKEADKVKILSGVFEGVTTGTSIGLLIENTDAHSSDYSDIADKYRPGHADYTYDQKYGFRDWRGGGRSSGRETAARVAAGAVADLLLKHFGIEVKTEALVPNAIEYQEGDSVGGLVTCRVTGLPAGLGEPVFDKLDARLAAAILSIGAVKGVEFGSGFSLSEKTGSESNDGFAVRISEDGSKEIYKTSNHAGGILGGISDGSELFLIAAVKPTPSVSLPQKTVTRDGEETEICIKGRHDVCIAPRAAAVVSAMVSLTLIDMLMENAVCRLDSLEKIYKK